MSVQDVILALVIGLGVGFVAGGAVMTVLWVDPLQRKLERERSRRTRRMIEDATAASRRIW